MDDHRRHESPGRDAQEHTQAVDAQDRGAVPDASLQDPTTTTPVYVKVPKSYDEMSDAERDAFAEHVFRTIRDGLANHLDHNAD
jgi:hypothetical protein